MSILNYAPSITSIISGTELQNNGKGITIYDKYIYEIDSSKSYYPSIVFTQDKHILTHGVDLLADFNGNRGLVPNYNSDLGDYAIFGKTGWEKLTTDYLPILDPNNSTSDKTLMTTDQIVAYVKKEIGDGFAANDAMLFVGTFNGESKELQNYNTNIIKDEDVKADDNGKKLFTNLKNYKAGWTFRVSNKGGQFDGKTIEIGDMLICVSDYTTEFKESDWEIIQTNINGYTTVKINGTVNQLYSNNPYTTDQEFYAPTTSGSKNQILVSNGNSAPIWATQSFNCTSDGTLQLILANKIGDPDYSHILSTSVTASKVKNALTVGTGLQFNSGTNLVTSYDGSTALMLNLTPATSESLGGVIVNDSEYLVIDDYGSLTFNRDALKGFVGGEISAAKYTLSTENIGQQGVKLKLSGDLWNSDVSIKHGNGITINADTYNQSDPDTPLNPYVTISLLTATSNTLGGVKLMRSALTSSINPESAPATYDNSRNYAVDLDKDGKMFVNVPWTDSNNTWREIRINDKSIGNSILNIAPSSDIVMSYENEETGDLTDGVATISFKLGIYNLARGEWEYSN